MSLYPYWSLGFDLRDDLDPRVPAALDAVARGAGPDLDGLPAEVRERLAEPARLLADEDPVAGTPVRLWRGRTGRLGLSIEFCQHDDDFANGGWLFWLWVLSLARRPRGTDRVVIGHRADYRNDPAARLVVLDAEGVSEGDRTVSYADIDAALAGSAAGEADGQ